MPFSVPPELVAPVHIAYALDGVVLAAVANGGPVYVSADGRNWSTTPIGQPWKITTETDMLATGGSVDSGGDFFHSADGRRWALVAAGLADGSHWAVAVPAPT